jgi:hypothetical protein
LLIAVFAQRLIWTPEILKDFFVVICIVFGTSALFAIMQAFNVDLAINICQVFFASENVEELGRMGRQIGAGYNPNNFAKMLMMSYCVIFTVMFFFKKYRFLLLMLILTIIISIFSSGSRSGNTALIVVTFLILFLTLRKVSLLERIFFALVILPAFYFIFEEFFYMSNYIQNFFDILRNPYTDESFARRWQIGLPGSLEIFYTSPIFGIGPAKGSFQGFVDSEYYYILSRYGGAGIIWLFSFYFLVINNFYKLFKRSLGQNIEVKITGISFLVLNIGVMVTNIANNNIGGVPIVMSLYFTLLAIAYSYSSQILNSKMKSRL